MNKTKKELLNFNFILETITQTKGEMKNEQFLNFLKFCDDTHKFGNF